MALPQFDPPPSRDPLALRAPLPRPAAAPRQPAGTPYRGVPAPIRVVLYLVAALAIGAIVGANAPTALRRIGAVAALQPGLLAWYSVRALGFMAYLAVAMSVAYGLLLSTGILDALAHRPVSFALHKDLAIAGLLLGTLHGVLLLFDQSFAFTARAILIPFASPYAPFWVGLGQLGFYGMAVVTASFYVRRRIGQRAWRMLHYVTFLVFVQTTIHGLAAGTDAGTAWAFGLYLVSSASIFFLLVYRITLSVASRRIASEPRLAPVPSITSTSETARPLRAAGPSTGPSPLTSLPSPGGRPSGRPAPLPGGLRWPT